MTSAFKNFFITFAICLFVFGFIGLKYAYPWLSEVVDLSDMGADNSDDVSYEASDDTSEDTSTPIVIPDNYDENGDVFTAVILCADSEGKALDTVFIDANGKSKQYIYCVIPANTRCTNEVGVIGPVSEIFRTMSAESICDITSSMTGIKTDYCLRFTRDKINEIAKLIPGANIVLKDDISFVNPKYEGFDYEEGANLPTDYYINISNVDGKVLLSEKMNGKTKLEWLLEYNPNTDGSEYTSIYSQICKSLIDQFFNMEVSMKDVSTLSKILGSCDTNLTADGITKHLETIFSHNDFNYHEMTYPTNWETAVIKLRELDGTR